MNKKKQRRNQERQVKQGRKKKKREKKVLYLKHTKRLKKKPVLQKVTTEKGMPLMLRIRYYIHKVIWWIKRAYCFIGIHDWKLCSGKERDSMYTCIRCWKGSKIKWGEGGSAKHYEKKTKEQLEIVNPKNWEKKEGEYYYKGKYVKLTKEEVRKLTVILEQQKDK